MFDRINTSMALASSSWRVLRQDKQLIVFPILSGIGCLLVLASFAFPFLLRPDLLQFANNQNARGVQVAFQPPVWVYAVAFAYYFATYFIIVFCNAALVSCALIRFHGGTPTVSDGIQAAMSRLPQILAWSLVSATVGVILKVIENAGERVGEFVSAILGTAWTALTYFVVPVLVVEKVGPFEAIQRSMAILKKTWGEALIGKMGIGFFMLLMAVPGIALILMGAMLVEPAPIAGLGLFGLAVIYFVGLSAVGSALHGIFLGALYEYAAFGTVPGEFDRTMLERAFAPKRG